MIRKIATLCLIIWTIAGAFEITTVPENPVVGRKITWTLQGLERETTSPVMLLVVHTPDTSLPVIIPGEEEAGGWSFVYNVPRDARALQYKIEDDEGPLADDDGMFLHTPVFEKDGTPRFDTYRLNANLYLGSHKYLERVRELLEKELDRYPDNWNAYMLLRRIEFSEGKTDEAGIARELDSLLASDPDSAEMLCFVAMEFFLTSDSLAGKGEDLMAECALKYPDSRNWLTYQYTIYNYITLTAARLGEYERNVFPHLRGQAKETGYFMLMSHALQVGRRSRITDIASRFLNEFPSSNLAPAFVVGMLQAKHDDPTADWAADMILWLEEYPDDVELNMSLAEYYRDRSWKKSAEYFRTAVKAASNPQPAMLFAEAAALKGKNFAEASKYLREVIVKQTPDLYRQTAWWEVFTVRHANLTQTIADLYTTLGWVSYKYGKYEEAIDELLYADSLHEASAGYDVVLYRRLLDASEKAGDLDARKKALLNLLVVEPDNSQYVNLLEDIYYAEHGENGDFASWLAEQRLALSLRGRLNTPIPDFTVYDTLGQLIYLSDFHGKVVVMNFWATWCGPCKQEIPELNKLVEIFSEEENVVFMGINNETPDKIVPFLSENPFSYDIYLDPPSSMITSLDIEAIPTHMVLDRRGLLQYRHLGFHPQLPELLEAEINALLEQ